MAADERAEVRRSQIQRGGRAGRTYLAVIVALVGLGWTIYQFVSLPVAVTLAAPLGASALGPGTGAVVGASWQDLNENAALDPGEPPLPGMLLTITSQDQVIKLSTVSGTDGSYRFDVLEPGLYTLSAVPPTGYELTSLASMPIFVSAGAVLTLNFGAKFVPTPTPTATLEPRIDVDNAARAICGSVIRANTEDGQRNVDRYSCRPAWLASGPELVYRVEIGHPQPMSASLIMTTADLDLFLLTSASPESCVAAGDNALIYNSQPGVYFLVVDGYNGAVGSFDLKLTCPLESVQATPTPTSTPSPTPTASATFAPSPTPTATMTPTPSLSYLPLTLLQPTPMPTATPTATPTPTPAAQQISAMPGVFWRDIHFAEQDTGYAVGGPDWPNEGAATLIKTTDHGRTWSPSTLNTTSWMAGLDCKDANTCWIAGRPGSMRRTTDGGAAWQALNKLQPYVGYLVSAKWTGNGDTVLFGGSSGFALRTPDGHNVSVLQTGYGTDQTDFSCPAAGTCYAAASSKGVLFSADDGLTWTLRSAGVASAYFNSVACTSVSTCWIAGTGGMVYRTTDGGGSWQKQSANIPSQISFNRVRMADAQHGYAVGCSNLNLSTGICVGVGVIYRTIDGVNWTALESFSNSDLMDLYVFSMTDVFIVDWGGAVWHYSG
jgi:hypothetical protein